MSGTALPLSIRTEGENIEIVNQLLLPHVVEYIKINSIEDAHDAIKTMKVRTTGRPIISTSSRIYSSASDSRRTSHRISCLTRLRIIPLPSPQSITRTSLPLVPRISKIPRPTPTRLPLHCSSHSSQPRRSNPPTHPGSQRWYPIRERCT